MSKNTGKAKLRNYVYIADAMVNSYFDQIRLIEGPDKVRTLGVSLSVTGPSVDLGQAGRTDEPSIHEKLTRIEKFLTDNADLDCVRPQELIGNDVEPCRFVIEKFKARKIIVPCKNTSLLGGVESFVVWISDPNPAVYIEKDYVWRGTFLYLVEGWHDKNSYHPTFSGCSALQFIMNVADGKRPIECADNEPLGRGNDLHPIDKLKRLGAHVSDQRQLLSLYRKRYITNEQCYTHSGSRRRVNDLIGYPFFLADVG